MAKDLLLVGSIPCNTVEEVFRTWGKTFAPHLKYLPDGEVGDRLHWIDGQAYRTFNGHPQIETVKRPEPDDGVERWKPRNLEDQWQFRVKPGVKRVGFADRGWRLGYARDAINSYFVFKTLKKEGVLPSDLRFMVALPTPESATALYFREPGQWDAIKPAYEDAMLAEIATMVEHIPPGDLAIQWDAACESVDIEFGLPWLGPITEERFTRYVDQFGRLSAPIPKEVQLGYHACYGTLGGWPTVQATTLANEVRFLNEAVARSKRHVDFVHLPTMNRTDDEYSSMLRDLKVGETEIYLGLIHNMESFKPRLAAARKYLKSFKIAAPCGFGRITPAQAQQVLKDHQQALAIFEQPG
ncbi:MAG TPA: hypothetical protein VMD75_01235 [Candidatus Binataceae bacterium]|nr:hypothetical protein [Candidatus Binataceae bacterium]